MRRRHFAGAVAIALFAVVLTGCVSVPDSIKGTSPTPQEDLARVMSAPQLYIGQESRFGGKVLNVSNNNGMTRLEIAAMPLDDSARPVLGAASIGRVLADVKGFLEPTDFNNQMVTVVGPISRTEKGAIGKANYDFVVVNVTGYQRWHLTQQVIMPPPPMAPWIWYGPSHGHRGYWGPGSGLGWYNPGPAQVQTILTE